MFRETLIGFGYPAPDCHTMDVEDDQKFRKLICWLESNLLQAYQPYHRYMLQNIESPNWENAYRRYKLATFCPITNGSRRDEVEWFLTIARPISLRAREDFTEKATDEPMEKELIAAQRLHTTVEMLAFRNDEFRRMYNLHIPPPPPEPEPAVEDEQEMIAERGPRDDAAPWTPNEEPGPSSRG